MFKTTIIAGAGGFVGTCLRFALNESLGSSVGSVPLPAATFVANMLGCLAIGWLYGYADATGRLSKQMSAMLTTGFCGGLTTFSAFSAEMMGMVDAGQFLWFWIYLAISVMMGIAMVALGSKVAAMTCGLGRGDNGKNVNRR